MDTRNGQIITPEQREIMEEQLAALERSGQIDSAADLKADLEALEPMRHHPTPIQRARHKVGRNDPCPCGSTKKFKKCCLFPTRNESTQVGVEG